MSGLRCFQVPGHKVSRCRFHLGWRPLKRRAGLESDTGRPKGAVHVHQAVLNHAATGRYALELKPGAIYWCTAGPDWVTGTSYGIIALLVHRATLIIDEAEYDLDRWYQTIECEQVEVWYTAPTAIQFWTVTV